MSQNLFVQLLLHCLLTDGHQTWQEGRGQARTKISRDPLPWQPKKQDFHDKIRIVVGCDIAYDVMDDVTSPITSWITSPLQ